MKTAVIQIGAGPSKNDNIAKALWWVKRAVAQKAEFILLPEMFNFRGKMEFREGYLEAAERFPGPSTAPLMAAAKKHKVVILAGSICERVPGRKKVYNTSVLIDTHGNITAKYRKRHLFDAAIKNKVIKESRYFMKGVKGVLAKVGQWTLGMSICYDLRFPSLYAAYARAGADILCVPSAFMKTTGQAHWETLLRARAIENFCYVLAPNQIGLDGQGVASYGHSMVIGPWGNVLARAGANKEEVIFAGIQKEEVNSRRQIFRKQSFRG